MPPRGGGDGWFDRLTNLVSHNAWRNSNQGEASPTKVKQKKNRSVCRGSLRFHWRLLQRNFQDVLDGGSV